MLLLVFVNLFGFIIHQVSWRTDLQLFVSIFNIYGIVSTYPVNIYNVLVPIAIGTNLSTNPLDFLSQVQYVDNRNSLFGQLPFLKYIWSPVQRYYLFQ